ncbi:cytochrome c oxidase assembly protein COX15-like isoform X2 [Cornus florida]|uniref:cytochrome c oxidase assembly protein COX15-like isoform X2 n=1 Tax=Cornus florida TaxID=4283 RepID=UPI0028988D4E|nr:cytochrome c oxidase assembly protein COX15-like isoform X2 [Cornus florida]
MFGRRLVSSLLKRSKDLNKSIYYNVKGSSTRVLNEPSLNPCRFYSVNVAGRSTTTPVTARNSIFYGFRSTVHHHHRLKDFCTPSFRNMCTMTSANMINKEGLKLLVTAGPHAQKVVGIWLFASAAWVFSMVVLGGVTRLTRSGLSMTDWKFTGDLPPLSDDDWLIEFEKYKQSPEYKRVNKGMSIEDFKFIYWMEYAHRMWGRGLGIMFALPFSYFLRKGYITLQLGMRLSVLFALGAGQGLIGWWMVKSGLEEPPSEYSQPRVSPYRLAAHLTSAFVIYCGLFWTALSVVMPEPPAESVAWVRGAAKVKKLALPLSILVGITAVSGAFVAGNDAGHAFNTFPKMGDTWIPDDIFSMKPLIRNFFENTSMLDHRILATATLVSIGGFWWSMRNLDIHPAIRSLIGTTMGMAALQVTLGISTLLSYVPVSLGTAHQAGALTLLTLMILLNHTVRKPSLSLLKTLPLVAKSN